ncbi:MAG: ATP synthase F0 subunit B [Vicinamibacterales bacterium]
MIPDSSVVVVIALVLACTVVLNTLIFKPILRVMNERSGAVRDARELADSAAQKAAAAASEYDRTLTAARTDVYRQMDEKRRVALDERAALLAATRGEVERELGEATARVRAQSAAAQASLDQQAGDLAGAIVERVLGRAS